MDNDFEKLLQDFSKSLNKLVPNMEQKKKITQAGAKVIEEKIRQNTPVSKLNHKKEKHLKEYVMS